MNLRRFRPAFEEVANILAHNLIVWSTEPVQEIDGAAFKLPPDAHYPD
jgi:hypothetical protein